MGVRELKVEFDRTEIGVPSNTEESQRIAETLYVRASNFVRRTFDFVGALCLIIVFAPLAAVISVAILVSMGRPIIYRQKRVGKNNKSFEIFKFRSMIQGAEQLKHSLGHLNVMTGPFFKAKNDPRVTPFGKILRTTSLDELPQIFNVLLGQMSLVGPRPMLREEVIELHCEDILRIKPGITGLWQVEGRSEISDGDLKLRLDREYIRRRSLALDIKLLCKTLIVVIRRRGAY